jgi:hypothetical protein
MKKRSVAFLAIALLLAGCGMPKKTLEEGKKTAVNLAETEKFVAERESSYRGAFAGERQWLAPYANREKWQDKIAEAKADVARLKTMYSSKLKPLLDENKKRSESEVTKLIGQLATGFEKAKDLARYPSIRAGELENAKAKAPEIKTKAMDDSTAISALAQPLLKYIEGVRTAHRDSEAAIQKRTGVAQSLASQAAQASSAIQTQFANHVAGRETDYAAFQDASKLLRETREKIGVEDKRIRRICPELDQSWSRTLIDMKQQYFVQVSRVSWQESEAIEYPSENQYEYGWVEVSEKIYDQLDALPDDTTIAELRSGGFFSGESFTPKIAPELLDAMSIAPGSAKEFLPYNDNEADYEIANFRVDNYHRYSEEQNGVLKETDWIPVSAEMYEDHFNDLGMALQAKPYGKFADEVEEEPAPAGMAYVGNPKYGQWHNGPGGGSFWQFYGQYAFFQALLGMNHPGYSRTEWDEYRSYRGRNEPYYGGTNNAPRYGSASSTVQTNPRYADSTFARTGGFHTAQSDVRSAGVRTRGGGPGGGGK